MAGDSRQARMLRNGPATYWTLVLFRTAESQTRLCKENPVPRAIAVTELNQHAIPISDLLTNYVFEPNYPSVRVSEYGVLPRSLLGSPANCDLRAR